MQENLALDPEDVELPGYVEIAADVEDFALETTFTVAVSDPFRELDAGKLEDSDGLNDSLEELSDAMEQLMDGGQGRRCGPHRCIRGRWLRSHW